MKWVWSFILVSLVWNVYGQNQIYKTFLKEGTGAKPQAGDRVSVHYTGTLKSNGRQFDSSRGKAPFKFTLFGNEVITGWDYSVASMKLGERATFDIPAEYAYGASGSPPVIPPNAALVFDIELLEIRPAPTTGAQTGQL